MNIKDELNISDNLWAEFKAWTPTEGIDESHDDWIRLRVEIAKFVHYCFETMPLQDPVVEIGSWSLIPGANFDFFKSKYNFIRTNISYGNGQAPLDFLLDAMNMKELDNESVGCLIATDVLEYLPEPFVALREFYRVLKNGGHAVITVPYYFRINGPKYFRFSPMGLEKGLRDAGFDQVQLQYDGDRPLNIRVICQKKKRASILLVGGGAACTHVEHMKKVFRVVTTDTKEDAPTLKVVDNFYFVDEFSSKRFPEQLFAILKKEKPTAVMPSIHASVLPLNDLRGDIERSGVRVILPPSGITVDCIDKKSTAILFSKAGLPVVPELNNKDIKYPCFFKAREGAGGIGTALVRNATQLKLLADMFPEHLIQEYIEGDEYTVDVLCDFEGRLILAVPRIRRETGLGQIIKGDIVRDGRLIQYIQQLTNSVHFSGIFTVQCFKKNESYYFSEINPRMGGGLSFSILSGAPFFELLLQILLGNRVDYRDDWISGQRYSRAFRDFLMNDPLNNKRQL
ncbi:MAG: ATP-grasp domain-containing protein [Syntrophales bacterium]